MNDAGYLSKEEVRVDVTEFAERLRSLASKIETQRGSIKTEEATKTAFVMPFISTILGYDVFNPLEVVPEYIADVFKKKGEKVDYAILRGDEVQILIECKPSTGALRLEHAAQLARYFSVTRARIAVLTNGEAYHFFTDLDRSNVMDDKPFLVLDMLDIDETLIPELLKLTRDVFDLDSIISAAEELKYVGQLKRLVAAQFKEPEDEWVRFFATRVYDGSFTQKVKEQFRHLVPKATAQFLNEQVNDRLKTALESAAFAPPLSAEPMQALGSGAVAHAEERESGIVTTEEEVEAFNIVKAIACSEVKPTRIVARDQASYFAILLDDNNRKTVARLWFNGKKQKYLGTFDEAKTETKHPIDSLDEIYQFSDLIRATVRHYLGSGSSDS